MSEGVERLAGHHGLTLAYDDPFGEGDRPVPEATLRLILEGLGQDADAPPKGQPAPRRMSLPDDARCWSPASLAEAPGWGIFCQLYELRSARNWGIGDFADLAELAAICGRAGADFLGINPVHALFLADPDRRSPFFPSNRRYLNPLYIAPDRLGLDAPAEVAALREAELLDYPALVRVKLAALRAAFDAGTARDGLDAFAAAGGEALELHALFEAISLKMAADGHGAGWRDWPGALHDPAAPEVARLRAELAGEVRFHVWLQMIARAQLAEAADAARAAGMRIGLYLDLAVGEAPDGSATWSGAAAALPGLSVGAPPDMFATEGQNWGLSAPSPTALRAAGFAPFRDMIEAQLRDAGALRIDHAMALWQLFLVPEGASPAEGTHLRFPFQDMVRVLAELSQEHEAVVIGEDLGFVPRGFRGAMEKANILSYRILVFEQTETGFKGLARYPEAALACISTHDLPVLSAWWRGEDVERRREHGLVDEERSDADALHRREERKDLIRVLRRAGALRGRLDADAAEMPPEMLDACHRFLARTKSRLVGVRLADLVGPAVPTNLPGTLDEYPNWRPRSPTDLAALESHPVFAASTALMRQERPRPQDATA
ncbi:putative 4-alpha-glucanotransferase [Oceanicola granulosus HTCC2516]|uniref:4-alpha-glucanotransferase n=1 Tax=Oceanicola granulosus (strain ATCC BAA-861 / DSM 15982 / KCTC 12143 / HTCC2516) TaxID=314256 RepID=Q2CIQ2_OCEGH|nr:4-alpha-glucanotransferase [Oceanicola granulosus]EAR52537.1 putative 4-alpha-glucanotransferase [Oceanicola granulosus HTCC2516]